MIGRAAMLVAAMLAPGTAAIAGHVPFVGCAMDGQTGPIPAPPRGRTPTLPAPAAARLAWYATGGGEADIRMGVLAPRGWHCFGTYGSNGSSLYVSPTPIGWDITAAEVRGPLIQLSTSIGDTSGRFEVAAIAARLFLAVKPYVDGVEAEHITDHPLPRTPFPADKVTHRGPYEALFTTAAGKPGLGTQSHLAPGPLAIDGVAILHPQDDMSLVMLTARLPAADRPLVAAIIAELEKGR